MGCSKPDEEDGQEITELEEAKYQENCIYVVNDKACGGDGEECINKSVQSLPGNLMFSGTEEGDLQVRRETSDYRGFERFLIKK